MRGRADRSKVCYARQWIGDRLYVDNIRLLFPDDIAGLGATQVAQLYLDTYRFKDCAHQTDSQTIEVLSGQNLCARRKSRRQQRGMNSGYAGSEDYRAGPFFRLCQRILKRLSVRIPLPRIDIGLLSVGKAAGKRLVERFSIRMQVGCASVDRLGGWGNHVACIGNAFTTMHQ